RPQRQGVPASLFCCASCDLTHRAAERPSLLSFPTRRSSDLRPTPTEPAVIARAIDDHPRTDAAAYDQVIVGYLLQIADELKTAGSAEGVALRRRTSRLIGALKPETLRRLVEMGGDFVQRRNFVYDATDGMAVDAVLDIVRAAADSSHQTISHSLVRMLSKLAAHAEGGVVEVRPQADAALRDQVRRLLQGWTLTDPNPGAYGAPRDGGRRAATRHPGTGGFQDARAARAPRGAPGRGPLAGRARRGRGARYPPRVAGPARQNGAGDRSSGHPAARGPALVRHPQ